MLIVWIHNRHNKLYAYIIHIILTASDFVTLVPTINVSVATILGSYAFATGAPKLIFIACRRFIATQLIFAVQTFYLRVTTMQTRKPSTVLTPEELGIVFVNIRIVYIYEDNKETFSFLTEKSRINSTRRQIRQNHTSKTISWKKNTYNYTIRKNYIFVRWNRIE